MVHEEKCPKCGARIRYLVALYNTDGWETARVSLDGNDVIDYIESENNHSDLQRYDCPSCGEEIQPFEIERKKSTQPETIWRT